MQQAQVTGLVLSRHAYDEGERLQLRYWLWTPAGPHAWQVTDQEAVFFIPAAQRQQAEQVLAGLSHWRLQTLALQDFERQPVVGCYCANLSSFYRCRERLQEAGVRLMEEDIRPQERYLMERGIRAGVQLQAISTASAGSPAYRARPSRVTPKLRWLSLDIETSMDARKLYCIGLLMEDKQEVLMLGQGQDQALPGGGRLCWYADRRSLLLAFEQRLVSWDPDVILGWNLVGFDLQVLARHYQEEKLPLQWGRGGELASIRQSRSTQHVFVDWPGRVALDGIDTLKNATWQFESYALNAVAKELLGREKLIEDPDQRGEEISRLYRQEPQALAAYNLEDCRLVADIFAKAELLDYLLARAELTGLSLDRVGGSAAAFDNLYLPALHRKGYVAPVYASGEAAVDSPGGFVMNSRPGLYEHVLVLDFKSLYPSIIRSFLIDPYALVEGLSGQHPEQELVEGFNQARFWRQQPILPEIVTRCHQAREEAKRAGKKVLSTAIKIIMNSFYGVLGSPLCRFFDRRLSSSITLRGHQILQQSKEWIEAQGYGVIYGDTDSLFVWLKGQYDEEQACNLGQALAQALNQWWEQHLAQQYGLESYLEIEFETHYSRFFMPTIRGSAEGSKKRYAGLVWRQGEPQLIVKGLESVRTDWTPFARQLQRELYLRIFLDQPYSEWLRERIAELRAGRWDEALVFRKRLRRPLASYQRQVPPHVQAARKLETWRLAQGLTPRYQRGSHVEYVLTLQGAEPLGHTSAPLDYELYIQRQVKPMVDAILQMLGSSFEQEVASQLSLFD